MVFLKPTSEDIPLPSVDAFSILVIQVRKTEYNLLSKFLSTEDIISISQVPLSLETPVGDEEGNHLGDFVEDFTMSRPDSVIGEDNLREGIRVVLNDLTDREARVIRLRFGFDDGKTRTLEEVGLIFDVTRERIRQIESKALRKLRHPNRIQKLKEFGLAH